MSEQDKQEAAEHAARAARQARHATKNAGRAAAEGAEYVAEEGKRRIKRFNLPGLAAISSDTGIGFLALSVSLYAGVIAFDRFNSAYHGRYQAVKP
jgi:hypothetical protein